MRRERRTRGCSTGSVDISRKPLVVAFALVVLLAACSSEPAATDRAASPTPTEATTSRSNLHIEEFDVPSGAHPHDVAVARDGKVWFTAQAAGYLGLFDPVDGTTKRVPLGEGAAPHGVIVGPDEAAWVTDGGLNAIVRVDPKTHATQRFPAPDDRAGVGFHTATFDPTGALWFTGQSGVVGRLDVATGAMDVFDAPGGAGPYGITSTPRGDVYYASLQGSFVARIDDTGRSRVLRPPTADQGARRVWSDSHGSIWVSEWNAGKLARYDPRSDAWKEWRLPGRAPTAYAVFVDADDVVWVTDFGGNAIHRFDPERESFTTVALPSANGEVRQLLGRNGEVWGAESRVDKLVVVRSR